MVGRGPDEGAVERDRVVRIAHDRNGNKPDVTDAAARGVEIDPNQEQVSAVVLVELRRQGEFDTREQQQPTQYRIRYRFEQRIAALAEAKPEHDKHEADQNGRGRCVLDMLRRADSPMMAREIAAELAARYQIDASNMDATNGLVAKVRNTLARQRGLASEMRGDAKAWRVEA